MRRILICRVGAAIMLATVSLCDFAHAQSDGTGASPELIIVTGTRIPRKDFSSVSPVMSFGRNEVGEFGARALEDFLNTLPQVSPDLGRTSNYRGDGTASINLRGLGRGRTLILLDGRRIAPTGVTSAIDVNAIPAALIERVEVITGGASAVYGSDAVTGAVNFITRKDFQGIELSSQFEIYGDGDGETYNVSAAGGRDFADGRGHVSLFADYLDRTPVFQGDRDFARVPLFDIGDMLVPSGSFSVPGTITIEPDAADILIFNPDGTVRPFDIPGDLYNFAPPAYLQVPLERASAGALADFDLTPKIALYTELLYSQPIVELRFEPAFGDFIAPLVIDGPFFAPSARPELSARFDADMDGLGTAFVSTNFEAVGPRSERSQRDYYRGLIGARASLGADWLLDAFYSYSRNDNEESLRNAVSQSRVLQGLLIDPATGDCLDPSGGCVAVNIFGAGNLSPAARDFIALPALTNAYQSVQHNAGIVATGGIFSWSEGTVAASLGAEYRHNAAFSQPDPLLSAGDVFGFEGFAGARGAITVRELYGELLVPIADDKWFARHLEIELGGRYSHYSSAGTAWTWKAGGQWRPIDGLRFSGAWQRAIRAPNVEELFTVEVRSIGFLPFVLDFCAASNDPVGAGLADVCIAQGMDPAQLGVYDPPLEAVAFPDLVRSGNPDLAVERASTTTAGFDYTFDLPFDLRIGADYFLIDLADAISMIDRPLLQCAIGGDPAADACRSVRRDPSGFPTEVLVQPYNVAAARAEGVDMRLEFGVDAPRALRLGANARLTLRSMATYYLTQGSQLTPVSPFLNCAGYFSASCLSDAGASISASVVTPEAQVISVFALEKERVTASLRWRWLSAVDNLWPVIERLSGLPPSPTAVPSVGDRHYLDIALVGKVVDGVQFRLGVDNVMATKPPLLGNEQAQANTDPSRYDVFGRRFYFGITVSLGKV